MAQDKKTILRRRRAVESIRKITQAMKLVAAAKLRRAQERVLAARPYAGELTTILRRLVAAGAGADHELLAHRESLTPKVAYVIISADRGLAGSYNANLLRRAYKAVRQEIRPVMIVTIGRRARDFFVRRGLSPELTWMGLGEEARLPQARIIVGKLLEMYVDGQIDEVRVIYTEFLNAVSQRPQELMLLPVPRPEGLDSTDGNLQAPGAGIDYIYEPSAEEVLNILAPKYVETIFFQTMLEAKASEHGARMTAMSNATENATELIGKLLLQYNRVRQAGITTEISEIIGGVEALK